MNGVEIINKQKLFFVRHAESYGNIGQGIIDSPLTEHGIIQASQLVGHFDCVVVSPLRRAKETLHYSKITYDNIIINDDFRGRIFGITDQMVLDKKESEHDYEFNIRVDAFHQQLESLCCHYNTILLIGHAYYFNSWYRKGCFPSPPHAEIIELI
jgi:phosphohistidine phosphatase SixA